MNLSSNLLPFCLSASILLMWLPIAANADGDGTEQPATVTQADAPQPDAAADAVEAPSVVATATVEPAQPGDATAADAIAPTTPQSATEAAASKYLLRYQFQEGQKLKYDTLETVTHRWLVDGGQKTDKTSAQQKRIYNIGESKDGTAAVTMQFEYVRMEIQTDDQPAVVFESTMPEKDVPQKFRNAARRLKSAAPTFTVHVAGTPVTDEGVEVISDGSHTNFMIPLPKEPVSVGDSWKVYIVVKVKLAEDVMQDIRLLRSYRLKAVEDQVAEIGFSTSVVTPVKSPAVKAQLMQTTPQGSLRFDLQRGVLLSREMSFDRSVLGALGPNTMLESIGKTVETLTPDRTEPAVSSR